MIITTMSKDFEAGARAKKKLSIREERMKNGKFPFERQIKNKVSMSMNEYLIKKITMRTYVVR
jgi:hypothetical protein